MFVQLRAKARLISAVIAYGNTPTDENELKLRTAFGDVIGRPSEQWSVSDWSEYETAKAQRPAT